MNKAVFEDLHNFDEDKRIAIIGAAVASGNLVDFVVVDSEPGKADRYISKLKALFPGIIVERMDRGPVKGTVAVRVRSPIEHN